MQVCFCVSALSADSSDSLCCMQCVQCASCNRQLLSQIFFYARCMESHSTCIHLTRRRLNAECAVTETRFCNGAHEVNLPFTAKLNGFCIANMTINHRCCVVGQECRERRFPILEMHRKAEQQFTSFALCVSFCNC